MFLNNYNNNSSDDELSAAVVTNQKFSDTDELSSDEIEDDDLQKIIILDTAKKSFKNSNLKFTNLLITDDHKKNMYLKIIVKSMKEYFKERQKFLNSLQKLNLMDENSGFGDLAKKINKNNRIKELLKLANVDETQDLNYMKLTNLKITHDREDDVNNIRIIYKYEENFIFIYLIDLYHLFTITNSNKYKKNYYKNQNHKEKLEKFFEKIEPKYKNWNRK